MNPELIGGKRVFEAVVDNLYARILLDDELAPYFSKVSLPDLRKHQVEFLSCIISGAEYKGRSMAEAHKNLGITEAHFSKVATHLVAALEYGKVDTAIKDKLVSAVLDLKNEIINK